MVLIRLAGNGLFVWSPIALTSALHREVDALGPVHYLVAPNPLHHLFLAEWRHAYPQARLYAAPGLARTRCDLVFDGVLGDAAEPGWAADIDHVAMRGSLAMTEIAFFSSPEPDGDLCRFDPKLPAGWFHGWRRVVARLDGIVAPHPGAPREWRASFVARRAARAALGRTLAWPIERVLIAHGEPATSDGRVFVRRAFAWLLGRGSAG